MRKIKKVIRFTKDIANLISEIESLIVKIISLNGWLILLIEMIKG